MLASVPEISEIHASIAPSVGTSLSQARRRRFRRPSRDVETHDRVVERAIPEGMQRPDHTAEVAHALRTHPEFDVIRADRKQALLRCVEALTSVADFGSMTTRPSWAKLASMLGVARRTVARYLHQLRSMGLLGVVASGRSAAYAAKGLDGQRVNETAVYVLCVPKKVQAVKAWCCRVLGVGPGGVDESGTPPSEAGLYLSSKEVNPRTRTRKGFSQSAEQKRLGYSVEQVRWNRHWVASGRRQQQVAAWRLKTILPHVLGRMTDRDIASCLRDFLTAGWSVADVHYALDHRPDGSLWPHSGAPTTKEPYRIRGWLRYRLNAWRDATGQPVVSRSQRQQAQRESRQRQRQVEVQQQAVRKHQVQAVDPGVKHRALATMRGMLRRAKVRR